MLVQPGQRHVRWRQPGCTAAAVGDQGMQFTQAVVQQGRHGARVNTRCRVAHAQAQHALGDLGADRQRMPGLGLRVHRGAEGFRRRRPVREGIESAVDLAQVVENDLRLGQGGQRLALRDGAQVLEQAMTHALVGHLPQMLLDPLERLARLTQRIQLDRIQAGEPADRARQVDVRMQVLPAMPFQVDQDALVTTPAAKRTPQGGQQQIVDLRAVGGGRVFQQGLCGHGIELARHAGLLAARTMWRLGLRQRQAEGHIGQLAPPGHIGGMHRQTVQQPSSPALVTARSRRQAQGLPGHELAIGQVQVLDQHAPRHPIDHQMVSRQQQAIRAIGHGHGQCAHQRAMG
ncbi:hypothetical protein AQB9606_04491 [Aquabacterium sp. CECT 9606]|nr:hypothetical protein AQB9606_04491 [Aquabacterium sp. CECT 9606]